MTAGLLEAAVVSGTETLRQCKAMEMVVALARVVAVMVRHQQVHLRRDPQAQMAWPILEGGAEGTHMMALRQTPTRNAEDRES